MCSETVIYFPILIQQENKTFSPFGYCESSRKRKKSQNFETLSLDCLPVSLVQFLNFT